ncbi:MAG TPA: hypothetical protein VL173_01580 [Vicinamibacterales bacterium]|nr:hypothetical protein [Vicinamibacterales bacterium]
MEVHVFPNSRRPGAGLKPRRDSTRPMLPQHSRHCPVLEAGSSAGFMVYAPLEPQESFHVGYEGDGVYKFVYFAQLKDGKTTPVFAVTLTLPLGGIGMLKEEVQILSPASITREAALAVMRVFLVPEDMGTPAGALALRGAYNFKTVAGWDTIYTPIFNMIERPIAPMLIVRVETDWHVHDTEFRYVMQPGEGISVSQSIPIGQVLFVPREEITFRDSTEREVEALRQAQQEFRKQKAEAAQKTPYGLTVSPHYLRESRARRDSKD